MTPEPVLIRLDPPAEAVVLTGVVDGVPSFERIAVPKVRLAPGEVLVAIELATVCASDRHSALGHRPTPTPVVLGHEQVGRVVALGPGSPATTVAGRPVAVGDRIVWGVVIDCGDCRRCRAGMPNKCVSLRKFGHEAIADGRPLDGGMATHAQLLPRTPIVVVGEALPATVAAPASCATATIVAALDAAEALRPPAGATVLVSGCGTLGLTAVAFASAAGARVVAVDPEPSRRALADALGAVEAVAPDGLAAALAGVDPDGGWDIAIECSGSPDAIEALLPLAGVGGALVLVGSVLPSRPIALDPEAVVRGLVSIRGVHNSRPEHLASAVERLQALDPLALGAFAGLVGETVPFAMAEEALQRSPSTGARLAVRGDPAAVLHS